MIRITDIKLTPSQFSDKKSELKVLMDKASKKMRVGTDKFRKFHISKKSIDARDKNNVFYVYSVDFEIDGRNGYLKSKNVGKVQETNYKTQKFIGDLAGDKRPIVIGSGPAGLFAAQILAEAGLRPIILERGKDVNRRVVDVDKFWSEGVLDENSNVQFGEGGAGTFSDGKLTTGTKDDRISKVLKELIQNGADESIAYDAKPHIGTDVLVNILRSMRERITAFGGEYRFENTVVGINHSNNKLESLTVKNQAGEIYEIETNFAVLAIGHSARDTFEMLHKNGVVMKPKSFAVGVRIEHSQDFINKSQYGDFSEVLPPADYKLAYRLDDGRGTYTFCMCPGGVVVSASSENETVVTNGMSYSRRDGENANSALLVNVNPSDFGNQPLDGIEFQRKLEKAAFVLGGSDYKAPVQLVGDFLNGEKSTEIGSVVPSYINGYKLSNLDECLDSFIVDGIRKAIIEFDKKIKGFAQADAVLTAVESRSSSPVTIVRNDEFMSNIEGLLPCGEGAGYAGGIISAAVDGIKCAEVYINMLTAKNVK